ncbi:hypothetical protein [Streptomyces sp. YGL11-2]|uniref:hypothetical protein n=1 Tax=Streptomyces sp. YGL11-2 TaxID=3414028 RepID=UPI003CFA88F8
MLRLLTAAGLAVDAYVHVALAGAYDPVGAGISEGTLFRAQAAAAALAAVLVLASGRSRWVWAFAFLVAASAVGAVLLYRYVDVGTLGPLPNMHEPVWYPKKTVSAVAEAVATLGAAVGFVTVNRHPTPSSRA